MLLMDIWTKTKLIGTKIKKELKIKLNKIFKNKNNFLINNNNNK